MILRKLGFLASVGLAMCLLQNASAWPDVDWTGLGGDGLWANNLNWTNYNTLSQSVPTANDANVRIDTANGSSVITIVSGETETPGLSQQYGTIFGPEWAPTTLNISGSLVTSWYLAPVGPSVINMYDGSFFGAEGIGLGANWWFNGAPDVTMNMYTGSSVAINWMWWGGHLNLYGGTMSIAGGVDAWLPNTNNTFGILDSHRLMNIEEGTLILPASFDATVTDWMNRGIIKAYLGGGTLVIDDSMNPGRTTVYALVPEPSALALLGLGGLAAALFLRRRSA